MFNPFRKSPKIQSPNKLWADLCIDGMAFATWVVDSSLVDGVLSISVRLPSSLTPEHTYNELCQHLAKMDVAIQTVELIVIDDKPTQTQVKTTNAMPNQTDVNKKLPIQDMPAPHPRIRHTIAIASGKGGVGKSTTTVNLALALQKLGYRVGILDADVYGPSIPTMLGVANKKPEVENEQFVPIDAHKLAMLSIGSLIESEHTPIAWRGIKATGALMQLYQQTNWPMLDYLLIDMPPGTGDIQLTLAQKIYVTAAVVVTTPQHIALLDAKKGIELFSKTQIPVLGIIENMALHTCSQCGHSESIFGTGGGEKIAQQYGVPLLGQLPLAITIRQGMDEGKPSVLAGDEFAYFYENIAKQIDEKVEQFAVAKSNRIF